MRESLNSRKYTVQSLTEIAIQMGIMVPGKLRKADIVDMIVAGIESAHAEALDENGFADRFGMDRLNQVDHSEAREIANAFDATTTAKLSKLAISPDLRNRAEIRVNNYMRFNGTDKLTPAQWRRVRKGLRKAGLSIGQLTLTYP